MKRNDILPARFDRCKEISEAEKPIGGLPRKCESHPLSSLIIMIDDKIVPQGLARKVTIHNCWTKKTPILYFSFQMLILRVDFIVEDFLVFFFLQFTFTNLPLTADQRN